MFNPPDSLWPKIAPTEIEFNYRLTGKRGMVRNKTTHLLNGVAGHAGLFSSATDIAKILIMLLNKGLYKDKRYLKDSTVELFTKRYSVTTTRGLGWDTGNGNDKYKIGNMFSSTAFGHTGYTGTSIWIDPEIKLFIIFLTNRTYGGHDDQRMYKFRSLVHDKIVQAVNDIIP